jgi:hypothetical protein
MHAFILILFITYHFTIIKVLHPFENITFYFHQSVTLLRKHIILLSSGHYTPSKTYLLLSSGHYIPSLSSGHYIPSLSSGLSSGLNPFTFIRTLHPFTFIRANHPFENISLYYHRSITLLRKHITFYQGYSPLRKHITFYHQG